MAIPTVCTCLVSIEISYLTVTGDCSCLVISIFDLENNNNNIILYSQSGIEHVHVQYKTYKEKKEKD